MFPRLLLLTASVQAAKLSFSNLCDHPIELYDNKHTCILSPKSQGCSVIKESPWSGMFRHGTGEQATLAEFSIGGGKVWYDISIIPPGPGSCTSLKQCMDITKKVGFNIPMSIFPTSHRDDPQYNCVYLACYKNGCEDAYQYPSDDIKTKSCPMSTELLTTFCPELPP